MLLALVIVAVSILGIARFASAAGTPDIALVKDTGGEVLFGQDATVSLRATDPAGGPWGYNLSFRDVLPPDVSYVPGSTSPSSAGEPLVIANQPTPGSTTLIWSNVADLAPNSTNALSYRVHHSQSTLGVGSVYTNGAEAFVNSASSLRRRSVEVLSPVRSPYARRGAGMMPGRTRRTMDRSTSLGGKD